MKAKMKRDGRYGEYRSVVINKRKVLDEIIKLVMMQWRAFFGQRVGVDQAGGGDVVCGVFIRKAILGRAEINEGW